MGAQCELRVTGGSDGVPVHGLGKSGDRCVQGMGLLRA